MAEKAKKTEAKKIEKTSVTKKANAKKDTALTDLSSANKLRLLYELQIVDSSIDNIKTVRGEQIGRAHV